MTVPMGMENNLSAWARMKMASEPQAMPMGPMGAAPPMPMPGPGPQGGSGLPFGFTPYTENPEYKDLIKQLAAQSQEAIAGQRAGVADAEGQLSAYKQLPMQMDLSPLAALTDTWSGGNISKGYTKPEGIQDRVGTINALQGGLAKARNGLSTEQLAYLKDRLGLLQKGDETKANLLLGAAKLKEAQATSEAAKGIKTGQNEINNRNKFNQEFSPKLDQSLLFEGAAAKADKILANHGDRLPAPGSDDYKDLEAAFSLMSTSYNQGLAGLGALAGHDLTLIEKAVGNNNFASFLGWNGGAPAIKKLVKDMRETNKVTMEDSLTRGEKVFQGQVNDLTQDYRQKFSKRSEMGGKQGGGSPNEPHPVDSMTDEQVTAAWQAKQAEKGAH